MFERMMRIGVVVGCVSGVSLADRPVDAELERAIDEALAETSDDGGAGEGVESLREPRWTASFEPMIWAPALLGDIGVGGATTFDVEDIDLDEPEATPAGRFALRSGDLIIEFSGFAFEVDETATAGRAVTIGGSAVGAGGAVDYELSQTSFELTVGHRLWNAPIGVHDPSGRGGSTEVWVDVYAGLRTFEIDLDFNTPAGESDELDDVHAILGLALRMDLPEGFGVNVSVDGGAGAEGSSFDITASFEYEFIEHATAQIGYRFLLMDLDDDSFRYETALAGLFGSIAIRF